MSDITDRIWKLVDRVHGGSAQKSSVQPPVIAFAASELADRLAVAESLYELDCSYYRASNPDLAGMSDAELRAHYHRFGIGEGRASSPLTFREGLIRTCESNASVLEIGPFYNPVSTAKNVSYFDVLDQDDLKARAKAIGASPRGVPFVEFVSPDGDLSIVDRSFAAAVSSHCIEHQPDLVRHLRDVGDLLEPGGSYFLIVPDKRYCFDHYIPETTIADVLQADAEKRTRHTLASVIEHRALVTHNDPAQHWMGSHGELSVQGIADRIRAATEEYRGAGSSYIDVHAWQFTPANFVVIMKLLYELGLSPFKTQRVFPTPHGRFEFTAILGK